jgi:hypothetical protein
VRTRAASKALLRIETVNQVRGNNGTIRPSWQQRNAVTIAARTRALRSEGNPRPRACGFRVTLNRARGGLASPAFQPGDNGLGGFHPVRHLFLRQTGARPCLDQGRDKGKLLFQRFILAPVPGVPEAYDSRLTFTANGICDGLRRVRPDEGPVPSSSGELIRPVRR